MKAIIYDFDGVLFDSVSIKQHAFFDIFVSEGKDVAEIAYQYHIEDNRNRFEVINYMCDYLNKNKEYKNSKLEEYKNTVINKIKQSKAIPGVYDFIINTYNRNIYQFVVSGTPHNELREIIAYKRLNFFIQESFGTPVKKTNHISYLLKLYSLNPEEVLFIGDMISDYNAANPLGLRFLARTDDGTFEIKNVPVITDFEDYDFDSLVDRTVK